MNMQENSKIQHIPVKIYRSNERLMIAAPMPGLQAEDISIQIDARGYLIIQGELRGILKDIKELLTDEWSVGSYYRELLLPDLVDAPHANITYGNGILVVALPISARLVPAALMLTKIGTDRGEYAGHSGHIEVDNTYA